MGVDCKLLPVEHDTNKWGFSHSVIRLDRESVFFNLLCGLPDAGPVPQDFATYIGGEIPDGTFEGETCYGNTQEDPNGDPIRCVRAGDIARLKPDCATNKAAVAYFSALDPTMRVAVWWC